MLWLDAPYPADADPDAPGVSRGKQSQSRLEAQRNTDITPTGTCAPDSGNPEEVESQHPDSKVVFSNIKFGAIDSTYSA